MPTTFRFMLSSLSTRLQTLGRNFSSRTESADSLHDLDARMLADIGIHPSEIGSIHAESLGSTPLTRLRIALEPRHG